MEILGNHNNNSLLPLHNLYGMHSVQLSTPVHSVPGDLALLIRQAEVAHKSFAVKPGHIALLKLLQVLWLECG